MAYEVYLPKLGANMSEGEIQQWFVREGEKVEVGDPLFELVTDKAVVEITAESPGNIRKILVPAGEKVPILT